MTDWICPLSKTTLDVELPWLTESAHYQRNSEGRNFALTAMIALWNKCFPGFNFHAVLQRWGIVYTNTCCLLQFEFNIKMHSNFFFFPLLCLHPTRMCLFLPSQLGNHSNWPPALSATLSLPAKRLPVSLELYHSPFRKEIIGNWH